jgi:hypothetical protein
MSAEAGQHKLTGGAYANGLVGALTGQCATLSWVRPAQSSITVLWVGKHLRALFSYRLGRGDMGTAGSHVQGE